jgi:hypothetical protein
MAGSRWRTPKAAAAEGPHLHGTASPSSRSSTRRRSRCCMPDRTRRLNARGRTREGSRVRAGLGPASRQWLTMPASPRSRTCGGWGPSRRGAGEACAARQVMPEPAVRAAGCRRGFDGTSSPRRCVGCEGGGGGGAARQRPGPARPTTARTPGSGDVHVRDAAHPHLNAAANSGLVDALGVPAKRGAVRDDGLAGWHSRQPAGGAFVHRRGAHASLIRGSVVRTPVLWTVQVAVFPFAMSTTTVVPADIGLPVSRSGSAAGRRCPRLRPARPRASSRRPHEPRARACPEYRGGGAPRASRCCRSRASTESTGAVAHHA